MAFGCLAAIELRPRAIPGKEINHAGVNLIANKLTKKCTNKTMANMMVQLEEEESILCRLSDCFNASQEELLLQRRIKRQVT